MKLHSPGRFRSPAVRAALRTFVTPGPRMIDAFGMALLEPVLLAWHFLMPWGAEVRKKTRRLMLWAGTRPPSRLREGWGEGLSSTSAPF